MAAALKNQKKVMLVGPSGVGKTETAKAFVEALIRGEYPELQGKFAFYYNTADIVDHFGGNMIGRIQSVAGRNLQNMVFIWDEFHVACKGQLADQMKTLFDRGPRSLPFAIVITTDEEARAFEESNHGALVRRFEKIRLHRPTDEEIGAHLPDLLLRRMPEAMIENPSETLAYLVSECKEKLPSEKFTPYQVHNAIEVLKLCFEYLSESQYKRPDEGMLKEQEGMRLALASSVIGSLPSHLEREKPAPIKQENEEEKRAFFLRRNQMHAVKRAFYEVGRTLAKASTPRDHDLKKFHLIQKVLPLMEKELLERANRLGLKTIIDKPLIDQAIGEILMRRTQKVDAED